MKKHYYHHIVLMSLMILACNTILQIGAKTQILSQIEESPSLVIPTTQPTRTREFTRTSRPTSTNTQIPQSNIEPLNKNITDSLSITGRFETVIALGFSPDDLVYDPTTNLLFMVASGDQIKNNFKSGIFKITLEGKNIGQIAFENIDVNSVGVMGYGIALATNGPKNGHFFLTQVGTQTSNIVEFGSNWNLIKTLTVTSSFSNARLGDAIAYNPMSGNIIISDEVNNQLFEITTEGKQLRIFSGIQIEGISFNELTNTYFGVNISDQLVEISTDGKVLQKIDLVSSGIQSPVGITSVGNRLYIADELNDNLGGYIYVVEIKI